MFRRAILGAAAALPIATTEGLASMFSYAESEEDRHRRMWQERKTKLAAEAETLIPRVVAAQSARLAKFQAALQEDIALWEFSCERWGDYLSVKMTRRSYQRLADHSDYAPVKSAFSIRLTDSPKIVLIDGHAPDLLGDGEFWDQRVMYEGDKEWTHTVAFPDVELRDEHRKTEGMSLGSSTNGYRSDGLGVRVNGIARPAEDDRIVFGEGGGRPWDDMMSRSGIFSYNAEQEAIWKRQRPGATINTPTGLGATVYATILAAIKAGS